MSGITDAAVARFVLRDFRAEADGSSPAAEQHLAACAEASVAHMDGENGTYGCDTGCEYARLTAQITCPHGYRAEHEYGDFGEIADILEEIQREESAHPDARGHEAVTCDKSPSSQRERRIMRVPTSELTCPLSGGTVRYDCPVDHCRWHWDERPGLEPLGPIRLPTDFAPEDVGGALTAMACELATAQARRVETVLRAHLNLAHPGYLKDQ